MGPRRHPAPGGLEPEQAAVGGGDADGSTAVIGPGHGDDTGGHGGTGAAAGAPRGQTWVPRVPARPPQRRFGDGLEAEFRGGGSPQRNQAPVPGPAHELRIPRCPVVAEAATAVGARMSRLLLSQILQQKRHPGEGGSGADRLRQRFGKLRVANGVQGGIDPGGALDRCLTDVPGRDLTTPDQVSQGGGVVAQVFGWFHDGVRLLLYFCPATGRGRGGPQLTTAAPVFHPEPAIPQPRTCPWN